MKRRLPARAIPFWCFRKTSKSDCLLSAADAGTGPSSESSPESSWGFSSSSLLSCSKSLQDSASWPRMWARGAGSGSACMRLRRLTSASELPMRGAAPGSSPCARGGGGGGGAASKETAAFAFRFGLLLGARRPLPLFCFVSLVGSGAVTAAAFGRASGNPCGGGGSAYMRPGVGRSVAAQAARLTSGSPQGGGGNFSAPRDLPLSVWPAAGSSRGGGGCAHGKPEAGGGVVTAIESLVTASNPSNSNGVCCCHCTAVGRTGPMGLEHGTSGH
mmetsp:Transcript_11023/g.25206  ORF Transcript_11023/g.25206 Transcript_11023/m.25206 type:complete len:273 (-) Transcript_11023:17-835(-)